MSNRIEENNFRSIAVPNFCNERLIEIAYPISREAKIEYPFQNSYNWDILDIEVELSDGTFLQRESVWNLSQKEQLIYSFIDNCYVPPIIIVDKDSKDSITGKYVAIGKVIDGKQRILALKDFLLNVFPVTIKDKRVYFKDLTPEEKDSLLLYRYMSVIYYNSPKKVINSDSFLKRLYNNLNYRGVSHLRDLSSLKYN